MKLFHSDTFVLPLPEGHRFPMLRYRLLRERLECCGLFGVDDICVPSPATDPELRLVHTEDWIHRVTVGAVTPDEVRRIGFPWSEQMVERCRRSTGATIAASRCALRDGVSANLAGGTHHAFPDRGAGYCVFNDVAVAVRTLQAEGLIRTALIADGDVHQGDGTAFIFQGDPSVRTFSLHAAKAFPARKMVGDVDLELQPLADDMAYLQAWSKGLALATQGFAADIIFFLAGADPFEGDTLGGLAVTKPGLAERDRLLFELCQQTRVPLVVVMAGGYAHVIEDIVDIQFQTIVAARSCESVGRAL